MNHKSIFILKAGTIAVVVIMPLYWLISPIVILTQYNHTIVKGLRLKEIDAYYRDNNWMFLYRAEGTNRCFESNGTLDAVKDKIREMPCPK